MTSRITKLAQLLKAGAPFHFIGIAGSGMAPLSAVVKAAGIDVSGSDSSPSFSKDSDFEGISVSVGHDDLRLVREAKTVVVSSAIRADNPELVAAQAAGTKILHRSELVALVSSAFKLITVSGTHGKSTTSALIAYLLTKLGMRPSYILGAKLLSSAGGKASAAKLDEGDYLVLEADESDGSFLRYEPYIAVVTNIDPDHMEFFGSMEAMEDAFHKHLTRVKPDGLALLHWDHARVRSIAEREFSARRLTYGSFIGSEVRLLNYRQVGGRMEFEAVVEHERQTFSLPLIGRHNAVNAVAAVAVAKALEAAVGLCAVHLASFPGVSRRLSLEFSNAECVVYDDYAHNPVKIQSCLEGLRQAFPQSRIVAVFQAHRYSRLRHLYEAMLGAFKACDEVISLPVYAAGEPEDDGYPPDRLARDITKFSATAARPAQSLTEASKLLQLCETSRHSVFVTIGAGDVWTVARDFSQFLTRTRP